MYPHIPRKCSINSSESRHRTAAANGHKAGEGRGPAAPAVRPTSPWHLKLPEGVRSRDICYIYVYVYNCIYIYSTDLADLGMVWIHFVCVMCIYKVRERERQRETGEREREREMDVDEPVDTYPIPASEDMHPVLFIDKKLGTEQNWLLYSVYT